MHDQPRYTPLQPSGFFDDGNSSRVGVAGTVARGQLRSDVHLYTGKVGGEYATEFPFPITAEMLDRGQESFDVFCSVCHDRLGTGNGMIVQRGFRRPQSFHIERLRDAPVGYFYDVVSNGFGAMPDYASQVTPLDRWKIIAYLRALQLSRSVPASELSDDQRERLDEGAGR